MGMEIFPVKHGSRSKPGTGFDLQILDDRGEPLPANTMGTMALKLPLPPGCLPTLWNNDQAYINSYLSVYEVMKYEKTTYNIICFGILTINTGPDVCRTG